jgi:hypothetical protein
MGEVLDDSFHFSISKEILGVSGEDDFVVSCFMGEGFDDKSNLESTVGGENVSRVNTVHLKSPVGNGDDSGFEISNINIGVFGLEVIEGFLGEVASNVVEVVGNEEMWEGFLNVTFDMLRSLGSWEFAKVTTTVEHGGIKLFES